MSCSSSQNSELDIVFILYPIFLHLLLLFFYFFFVIVAGGFEPWSSVLLVLKDCLFTHSYHLRWSSLERIYMNFYRVHLSHVLSQGGPTSFSTTCITRTTKKWQTTFYPFSYKITYVWLSEAKTRMQDDM